jgi:hypothetical protein
VSARCPVIYDLRAYLPNEGVAYLYLVDSSDDLLHENRVLAYASVFEFADVHIIASALLEAAMGKISGMILTSLYNHAVGRKRRITACF